MDADGDPIEARRRMWSFAPFTQLQNVTGQPAISLPLHWTAEGLPVGAQVIGRLGEDFTLIQLVSRISNPLDKSSDSAEDLVCGLGPYEGLGVVVPGFDPCADVGFKGLDAAVVAALE